MRHSLLRCAATLAILLAPAISAGTESLALPSFEAVRAAYHPSDWLLVDRHGEPLQRMRRDPKVRRLAWLALDQIPPTLQETLLAAEDKRFWTHGGVDWAAFAQAAWNNIKSNAIPPERGSIARGASTLSMQLAGLLDPRLQASDGGRRNLAEKWDQAQAAWALEKQWSKAQILEAYLNLVPWRGETVGLAAASLVWFGKQPDGLDLEEAALLAALVRQPQATPAKVGERACAIVSALDPALLPAVPRPPCAQIRERATVSLQRHAAGAVGGAGLAPHAARRALTAWGQRAAPAPVIAGSEPRLASSIDARIQRIAADSLVQQLRELGGRNVEDGAVIVLDNRSGEILAYVGSSGRLSGAAEVDGVTAARQAGSTLKPFLYGLALEQRRLTAASLLHDSPLALTGENGAYIPQNYDHNFKGWVSVRSALASSLNIPAVRTLLITGVDAFHARLKTLGLDTLTEPADHYGLALALGGADIRLFDLANAYRALANGGRWTAAAPLVRPPGEKPATGAQERHAMSPASAFIISDILADRGARAPTFGLENTLATRVWSAVKTGTSKDMRDNWCIGYTSHYTVGVWVGNFSGAPMWNVSGIHGAAPVWRELVHALHEDMPSRAPQPPRELVAAQVHFDDISEAVRKEWFLPGTETTLVARADLAIPLQTTTPKIVYPADGLVVALDPDLPMSFERLPLRMEPERTDYRWQLARTSDLPCQQTVNAPAAWAPQPGRWRLRLLAPDDSEAGAVTFSVRGSARHQEVCD